MRPGRIEAPALNMARRVPRAPDKNKFLAETGVNLEEPRGKRWCRNFPGEFPNRCGKTDRCPVCAGLRDNWRWQETLGQAWEIAGRVEDWWHTDGLRWRYPPNNQLRGEEGMADFVTKTSKFLMEDKETRFKLARVGGQSVTAEDYQVMRATHNLTLHMTELYVNNGGASARVMDPARITERADEYRRWAQGFVINPEAWVLYYKKHHPETSIPDDEITNNISAILGLCWLAETDTLGPMSRKILDEIANWGEVRADLEYEIDVVWHAQYLDVRERTMEEMDGEITMLRQELHDVTELGYRQHVVTMTDTRLLHERDQLQAALKAAHEHIAAEKRLNANLQEANNIKMDMDRMDLIQERNQLRAALHAASEQLAAEKRLSALLQDAKDTKQALLAAIEEAEERRQENVLELRSDLALIDRCRADIVWMLEEGDRTHGDHQDRRGVATAVYTALRNQRMTIRDAARRVGLNLDPTPEYPDEAEFEDDDMNGRGR